MSAQKEEARGAAGSPEAPPVSPQMPRIRWSEEQPVCAFPGRTQLLRTWPLPLQRRQCRGKRQTSMWGTGCDRGADLGRPAAQSPGAQPLGYEAGAPAAGVRPHGPPLPRPEAQTPASPRARRGAGARRKWSFRLTVASQLSVHQTARVSPPKPRPAPRHTALPAHPSPPLPDVGQLLYARPGLLSGRRAQGPPGPSPGCDPAPCQRKPTADPLRGAPFLTSENGHVAWGLQHHNRQPQGEPPRQGAGPLPPLDSQLTTQRRPCQPALPASGRQTAERGSESDSFLVKACQAWGVARLGQCPGGFGNAPLEEAFDYTRAQIEERGVGTPDVGCTQDKGNRSTGQGLSLGCPPALCRLDVPMTPSSGSVNLPARLKELRETVTYEITDLLQEMTQKQPKGREARSEAWVVTDKMTNDQPQVSKLRRDSSRLAQKRGLKPDRPHLPAKLLTPLQDHGLAVSNPLLRLSHPAAPRSLSARTAPPGPLQLLTGCRRSQEREMRPITAFKPAQLNPLF
ncbi:unnamed protein product [Rangifer tarandus platyrhynchus]|uniref:Uncharacterized protein n=2 Tax=Rangifer tarandus platyrhynchus TaxID=3082113 RepID=A0ABN8YEP0_RANTA|nr:unnamed protein product [Rangifer tarandus platyrhynchus]CAI9700303.1 unnamed protein product [Rangifer tarandus platyrhynchus]